MSLNRIPVSIQPDSTRMIIKTFVTSIIKWVNGSLLTRKEYVSKLRRFIEKLFNQGGWSFRFPFNCTWGPLSRWWDFNAIVFHFY
ncbi:hypothetical protein HanIR_Chr09g0427311 [Helianthus annuus]|nr:hypothetical protein HanIR_Chr09g0427311 [Helianthus annuus]